MERVEIFRGDIVLVDFKSGTGSEQAGMRPAIILQNNISNRYSPTTIVAPITSKVYAKKYPTNVEVNSDDSGLKVDSTILLNQIRTIDKIRITMKLGKLNSDMMKKVDLAIKVSLGLD